MESSYFVITRSVNDGSGRMELQYWTLPRGWSPDRGKAKRYESQSIADDTAATIAVNAGAWSGTVHVVKVTEASAPEGEVDPNTMRVLRVFKSRLERLQALVDEEDPHSWEGKNVVDPRKPAHLSDIRNALGLIASLDSEVRRLRGVRSANEHQLDEIRARRADIERLSVRNEELQRELAQAVKELEEARAAEATLQTALAEKSPEEWTIERHRAWLLAMMKGSPEVLDANGMAPSFTERLEASAQYANVMCW